MLCVQLCLNTANAVKSQVLSSTESANLELLFPGAVLLMQAQGREFDYREALEKSLLFYEGQRSGKLPETQRMNWRGDSALVDGNASQVDLRGGYYDAGDNVKYQFPMAFTTTLLSWSVMEYESELLLANQLQHAHESIRWATDYFLKAVTSPTQIWVQVGDPHSDHECWERAEDMDTLRLTLQINETTPGTEVAAETAAAMAASSIVFRASDPLYAERLLGTAMTVFDFADKYRGTYHGACPFYCSSGYNDELLWAAAWLYQASNDTKFLKYVVDNSTLSHEVSEFSWDNKHAGTQILLTKSEHHSKKKFSERFPHTCVTSMMESVVIENGLLVPFTLLPHILIQELYLAGETSLEPYAKHAAAFVCHVLPANMWNKVSYTPGGLLYVRVGANTQYVTGSSFIIVVLADSLANSNGAKLMCGNVSYASQNLLAHSKNQVDYILGSNPLNMSYMAGFGPKYPTQVHQRSASIISIHESPLHVGCGQGFVDWFPSDNPNPNVLVGAIVGGPDINDNFKDSRRDSSCTEPTTYINSGFVGLLARLLRDGT
uniref:cellulase n=1 Tax=Physcomitrium patens TaxID=3218 RepID=A0A2K1IYX9_PHYPA|nr:hypothetical protein PHYPA_024301 [Physcomitrium patens]